MSTFSYRYHVAAPEGNHKGKLGKSQDIHVLLKVNCPLEAG